MCQWSPTTSRIVVIILTNLRGAADRLRNLELRVDAYITKLFSVDDVLAQIPDLFEETQISPFCRREFVGPANSKAGALASQSIIGDLSLTWVALIF